MKNRYKKLFDLNGKVAIITGSSRGIGASIAEALAEFGASVVVSSRSQESIDKVANKIIENGFDATTCACHVGDESQLQNLVDSTIDKYGRVDILVNNAGIHIPGSIEDLSVQDWDKVTGVNIRGVFFLSKNCIELLKKSDRGRIIHIASVHAFGGGNGPAYASSKAGIINLTKDMSLSLGQYGITVNAICPGYIETPIQDYLKPKEIESFKETLSIKRLGKPKDIANAALFLASEESEWVTGTSIVVDGGGIAAI